MIFAEISLTDPFSDGCDWTLHFPIKWSDGKDVGSAILEIPDLIGGEARAQQISGDVHLYTEHEERHLH